MASALSVVVVWSVLNREFWDGQGPRWWLAVLLVVPVVVLRSRNSNGIAESAVFAALVAIFLSMSSGLFGLHDVWFPTATLLVGFVFMTIALGEQADRIDHLFLRYAGALSGVVALVWIPVFINQPVAA